MPWRLLFCYHHQHRCHSLASTDSRLQFHKLNRKKRSERMVCAFHFHSNQINVNIYHEFVRRLVVTIHFGFGQTFFIFHWIACSSIANCVCCVLSSMYLTSYDRGKRTPDGVQLCAFLHIFLLSSPPTVCCVAVILILICFFAHYYNFVSVSLSMLYINNSFAVAHTAQ